MSGTYLSCSFLEGHLNIGINYLSLCASAHAHAMNGCTQTGTFNGNRMPVETILAKRNQFLEILSSTPEKSPCFGCPELKMAVWPATSYLFDSMTINDFAECNLRCDYCSHTDTDDVAAEREKRTHQLLPLIKDTVENGHVRPGAPFFWGGGEVALYKDFEQVARYLMENGFHQFVNTNATYYSSAIEYGLKKANMEVQVSVDSGTRETYRLVKGKDLFDIVWGIIARYAEVGSITVKYIIKNNNHEQTEIDEFIRTCLNNGVRRIVVAPENHALVNHEISDEVLRAAAYLIYQAMRYGFNVNMQAENFGKEYGVKIREYYSHLLSDEKKILFSIIVPTFNQAQYLPACLESILSQTYPLWEAIIVNDGSTDDTSTVLYNYAARDRRFKIINKLNGGTASALNEGLTHVQGEWVCWLSSDDLFEHDKLAVHLDAIRQTPEGLFFHSGYSHLDDASGVKVPQPLENTTDRDLQVLNFFRSCWVHGNSFAAHRSIFEQFGGFTRGAYHNAQDFEMWLRISCVYELHYIPQRTCVTRIHSSQPSTQFFEAGKLDCVHACYDFLNAHKFPDFFPFLNLNQPDSARKAIMETIRLYLEPHAYLHAAGYSPALLERLYEWLENDSPPTTRMELRSYCDDLFTQVFALDLPSALRDLFQSILARSKEHFVYAPHDFFNRVVELSNCNDGPSRLMKRYLAEHLLFQAARDKLRSDDVGSARALIEHAYRILPFSALVKGKLAEIISTSTPVASDADSCGAKKPLRILLVNPPYRRFLELSNNTFPQTFGSMATMLKSAGFEVAIYDADFDRALLGNSFSYAKMFTRQHLVEQGLSNTFHPVWKEIDQVITDFSPDVIGITAMTTKYPMVERIAALAKAKNPNVMTVVGGHHPTILGEQILQNQCIDCVVVGEGEVTFFELMQATAQNKINWNDIPGIIFRNNSGEVVRTTSRAPIADLDVLPIPDRDLILNYGYVSDNNIISTRGCPFSCSYCGADVIWAHKQRKRSVANIIAEVRYLIERSGTRNISFWDDSFTCNKKHTLELMDALAAIQGLTFSCLTRLDLIDTEILAALRMAGCTTILFGIESGSDRILALMNKKMTRQIIREKTQMVTAAGISWLGFFIMGYPGETREDIMATLEFMEEINPPYAEINIFNPLPGTQTWTELEKSGKVVGNMDFSKHSQASTDNLFIDMPPDEFRELSLYIAREFDAHNARNAGRG